jgi:predicted DCC family thiol-disulfide oxidoreductase YuxK
MSRVEDLPAVLQRALAGRDLIVFDGECVLCSGFFRTMVRLDRTERFSFATAQSPLGAALYEALGLPIRDFETNLVIVDGVIHQRLDAFAAAMAAVGWPWRVLSALRFIPRPIGDFLYHRIARNRYAVFGRYDTCMMPEPALKARFVEHAGRTA